MEPEWTDARVSRLKELWKQGFTCSGIVQKFRDDPSPEIRAFFSRSAIIGKVHRLKLDRRRSSGVPSAPVAAIPAAAVKPTVSSATHVHHASPVPARAESRFNPPANRALALKSRPRISDGGAPVPRSSTAAERIAVRKSEPGLPQHLDQPGDGIGITITELTDENCHWPKGDPLKPDFRFCGQKALTGLPYCARHSFIAYQPAEERRRVRH